MSELKAVVQAGGLGTRLAPYSTVLPKALMPIGDATVVDHLLTQFSNVGIKSVYITISKFGQLIRSYCGDGSRRGVQIGYVSESEPLGTIGPLNNLREELTGPFFVSNSDVFTDLPLGEVVAFNDARPAPVTVVVKRQRVDIDYGVLQHDSGKVRSFQEKPSRHFSVSTGIYLMQPDVFEFLPPSGPFGFDQLMRVMLDRKIPVNVYEHEGSWIDIGRIEDLRRAQEHAARALVRSA
ncbi:MAG: nucleotidyltransferase [Actinomycetia bacterium]|nr:nucleotidyltransferase [Actinomycetes bacterium]